MLLVDRIEGLLRATRGGLMEIVVSAVEFKGLMYDNGVRLVELNVGGRSEAYCLGVRVICNETIVWDKSISDSIGCIRGKLGL